MKKLISFAKVEATGNDFILVNEKDMNLKWLTSPLIKSWCDRHFGIGADGLIHLSYLNLKTPRMRYFNANGSIGEMCGNGLRAVARYLLTIGLCDKKHENSIEADDGPHVYYFNQDGSVSVELLIDEQTEPPLNLKPLKLPSNVKLIGFRKVGVPHLVLETEEENFKNFESLAQFLRFHPLFGQQGTNVNLLYKIDSNTIKVRTFERGVEAETLSCGTGVTASALLFKEKESLPTNSLKVQTKGGNLKVEWKGSRLFLTGPANFVFIGQIILDL